MKQYLFDGKKTVSIDQLPPEAWTFFGSAPSGTVKEIEERYIRVPFLNRAVHIRANAVSTLPFDITNLAGTELDTSEDYQNAVGFLPNPQKLLYLVEASLFLMGQAYLFRAYNRARTLDLRYILATTILPILDAKQGLVGFKRQLAQQVIELGVEDLVYFWQLDPYVEIGPGNNSAAMAALSAAGVLFNVDAFASSFFERGAIKVTLLTTKGPVPEAERNRLKAWWGRMFRGTESAWKMEIVQADAVEPVVLGEGVKELSDSTLVKEKREDIATAAGVPVTKLWSSEAGGLGGGGVVEADERAFYENTVVPQARFIEACLNEQLFVPMGLKWRFKPETLDVFQEDENQRAQALSLYVNAGFRLSVAAQILGVELPQGMDYDDLDTMQAEDKEKAAERQRETFEQRQESQPPDQEGKPPNEAMRADLRRWQKKVEGKGANAPFESEHIPASLAACVRAALVEVGAEDAFRFTKAASLADLEQRLNAIIQGIFSEFAPTAAKAIMARQPVDLDTFSQSLEPRLAKIMAAIALEQALRMAADMQVEFDPAVVNEAATAWARFYSFDLVKNLTETTRSVIASAAEAYANTPGMTLGDVEDLLIPAFGEYRAEMIAITEITRAYAQAANMYQSMLSGMGLEFVRYWNTNKDEKVCPLCGPLDRQPERSWASNFPGGPPAHPRCRCMTTLEFKGRAR